MTSQDWLHNCPKPTIVTALLQYYNILSFEVGVTVSKSI